MPARGLEGSDPAPSGSPPGRLGLGASLPFGVLVHLAAIAFLVQSSRAFRSDRLPEYAPAHRIRLFAPPAAALRAGDESALPNPEDRAARPAPRPPRLEAPRFVPSDLGPLPDIPPPVRPFGADTGIPEGLREGLAPGEAAGVVGGVPGGTPGGEIGGLRARADPVLPPPDEPPRALAMPPPRFPEDALRDGVRGRVVLRALITERGAVEVLRVLRSIPALDAEAIRVVEAAWRFRPARRNGRPVASLGDLVVRFSLR